MKSKRHYKKRRGNSKKMRGGAKIRISYEKISDLVTKAFEKLKEGTAMSQKAVIAAIVVETLHMILSDPQSAQLAYLASSIVGSMFQYAITTMQLTVTVTGTMSGTILSGISGVSSTLLESLVSAVTNTAIAIDTSQITSGTLAVARGGTGIASYAVGDIIFASGSTTLTALAGVATGNVLISGGVATAPSYGKVGLTTHVSGTLAVTNGGTGFASYTANGVIIGGVTTTSALTSVASSTEGHVLQISSTGIPTFAHLNGGSF